MKRPILICAAIALLLLVAYVSAAKQSDLQQACNMCKNVNGGKEGYACPKERVSSCSININGWCCSAKRVHSTCKACFAGDDEDDEDDEVEDI